jgi:hypothetical protein
MAEAVLCAPAAAPRVRSRHKPELSFFTEKRKASITLLNWLFQVRSQQRPELSFLPKRGWSASNIWILRSRFDPSNSQLLINHFWTRVGREWVKNVSSGIPLFINCRHTAETELRPRYSRFEPHIGQKNFFPQGRGRPASHVQIRRPRFDPSDSQSFLDRTPRNGPSLASH